MLDRDHLKAMCGFWKYLCVHAHTLQKVKANVHNRMENWPQSTILFYMSIAETNLVIILCKKAFCLD